MIPIYAVGSLALIWLLDPVKEYIWIVLLCGSVITALLEYFTSYFLINFRFYFLQRIII